MFHLKYRILVVLIGLLYTLEFAFLPKTDFEKFLHSHFVSSRFIYDEHQQVMEEAGIRHGLVGDNYQITS